MKSVFIIAVLMSSASLALAAESLSLEVFTHAKVLSVDCQKPVNAGHDYAVAGTTKIKTEDGETVEMIMQIPRLSAEDVQDEAKGLCKELKAAMKKAQVDVLFEKGMDMEEKPQMYIKGARDIWALENVGG